MADTNSLNQAKVITAQAMLQEGYITQEQFTQFVSNYAFIVRKAGMWDSILEKIWGRPVGDQSHYDLVKVIVVDDDQAKAARIVDGMEKIGSKVTKQLNKDRFERIDHEQEVQEESHRQTPARKTSEEGPEEGPL